MLKHSLSGAALLAAAVLVPTAATAQHPRFTGNGLATRGYDRGGYPNRSGYGPPGYRPARCDSGTGGTIIGAIAGGLLGRSIDTHGDRTLGTVLGAGAGGLAGNAIGRSGNPGYCRR